MENPAKEVGGVIQRLTQSAPSVQRETVEKYFTTDAAFTHPFCRTESFDGSRLLIRAIYRWYKIMSPKIDLAIDSIAYDSTNLILYVTISQIFSIWFIPFHKAPVTLTTVLHLRQDKFNQKYYIKSQNDLYQTDQFVRFFALGGHFLVMLWQIVATINCVILAFVFSPVTWIEQRSQPNRVSKLEKHIESAEKVPTFIEMPPGSGKFVTAPAIEQR